MFGLIGKITAVPGSRDALAQILVGASVGLPGCHHYTVAADVADADTLWVTEVWDTEASHRASLSLPPVQEAIAHGREMIAGMHRVATTVPIPASTRPRP